MAMKLAILIIIAMVALIMPLLWIAGTLTSFVYFYRHRPGIALPVRTPAFAPGLGITMADGGDAVDEDGKSKRG
jgi:hypothetical protein